MYGKELILDIHNCDNITFNRDSIENYFIDLCELIDMVRCELYFWDDLETPEEDKQTEAHTKGTSAIQFILTSNITIHTLDELNKVFINIFSCKDFDSIKVANFTENWFKGNIVNLRDIERI
jgi:S-adenosylmethionine decarboxylase